jgi:hypothetical protein
MFNDKAASRAMNQWGRSMTQAGNSMIAASGQPQESPLVSLLKGFFWQVLVWKALRTKFKTEHALLLLPLAVIGVFILSAFAIGLFGLQIGSEGLGPLHFYLLSTALFWVVVFVASLVIWILTLSLRATRKVLWWVKRG